MLDVTPSRRDSASHAGGIGEKLDWDAFSAQYFPGLRRHELDAVAAYGAYRQGRDWQSSHRPKSPQRLTLVPREPLPADVETESDASAMEGLLFAVAAEQVWEGEGGFTP